METEYTPEQQPLRTPEQQPLSSPSQAILPSTLSEEDFAKFGPLLGVLGQVGETIATSFGLGAGPVGAAAGLLVLLGKLAQTQHGVSMAHIEPPQLPEDGSAG